MKDETLDGDYSVGNKKPPRDKQFKRGQSGNPKGRPRKIPTLSDILASELLRLVPIKTGGKVAKVPLLRAMVRQHATKATNGDTKSAELLLKHLKADTAREGSKLDDLVEEFRTRNAQLQSTAEQTPKATQPPDPAREGP